MKMTRDKLDAFCEMMTKELGKVNCCAGFDTDPEYYRTNIIVEHRNHIGTQYYAINWKEVRSLTEAAVPILVDIKTRLNSEVKNDLYKYVENDIEQTKNLYYGLSLTIKDVIFNPPATIILWMDGTKTVVKDQGEVFYDPEKGMAMAVAKKAFGNQGNYYNQFKKYIDIWEKKQEEITRLYWHNSALQNTIDKLKERLWKANYNSKCDYDVAEIECDYTYSRFGWKDYDDIHNTKIVKVKGGYMIDLPEPVEFD